jgi:hypothetical protein
MTLIFALLMVYGLAVAAAVVANHVEDETDRWPGNNMKRQK